MRRHCWLVTVAAAALCASASQAVASSHREAPLISEDPSADSTDVYMFLSPIEDPAAAGTVTIVANYIPLEEPGGGPNFYRPSDSVLYEIHIDNDGDAVADITYQLRFKTRFLAANASFLYNKGPIASPTDPNLLVQQIYSVTRIDRHDKSTQSDIPTAPVFVGARSFPPSGGATSAQVYEAVAEQAITNLTVRGGGKVFVGPRDDPFYVDLGATFDLLGIRPGPPGGTGAGGGVDYVAGYNVHSIVLQIPIAALTRDGSANPPHGNRSIIGVWTTASRRHVTVLRPHDDEPKDEGKFVQVSRLAIPLVNEVIVPVGRKDAYNRSRPVDDVASLGALLQNPELAQLIHALYGVTVPAAGRTDLIALVSFNLGFAPFNVPGLRPADLIRLDVSTAPGSVNPASRLGALAGDVAGFPNGRRLADDAVDIEERAMAGVLCTAGVTCDIASNPVPLGDGVDENDALFMTHFPYLAPPWSGSAGTPLHRLSPGHP
jgi:Domain of unknown function (DUF4331)